MFKKYSPPNENNTHTATGTVSQVCYTAGSERVAVVSFEDGQTVKLVYNELKGLYSSLGYNIDELSALLVGKNIEYLRMNDLSWAIEIYVDDIKINNIKATTRQIFFTRVAIVIIGLIMLAFPIYADITYLKSKHRTYKKAEKKRKKLKSNNKSH